MTQAYSAEFFERVLRYTRQYFSLAYEAGTREMIRRYVDKHMGYVPPRMISAAIRVLRDEGMIMYEARVWWLVGA